MMTKSKTMLTHLKPVNELLKSMKTEKDLQEKLDLLIATMRADRERAKKKQEEFNSRFKDQLLELKKDMEKDRKDFLRQWWETQRRQAMPSTRFNVIMPFDMAQDMQDLVEGTGHSRGEIFRRAIALYKLAVKAKSTKGNIILRDSDGTLREIVGIY